MPWGTVDRCTGVLNAVWTCRQVYIGALTSVGTCRKVYRYSNGCGDFEKGLQVI